MNMSLPPFNEKEKRTYIEETILNFSSQLFRNPKLGLALSLILNILYLYSYFKKKSTLSMLSQFFLLYLISSIIISKLLNFKNNK